MTETLNIHYHTTRLILKALNKYRYEYEAAEALQVSKKFLIDAKKERGIVWNGKEWKVNNVN